MVEEEGGAGRGVGGGVGVIEGEEAGEGGEDVGTRAGAGLGARIDELEEWEEPEEAGRGSWKDVWRRTRRSDGAEGIIVGSGRCS